MIIMAMVRDKAQADERQDHHCQHHPDYHNFPNRHADFLDHDLSLTPEKGLITKN